MHRHKILTSFILTAMTLTLACGGDDGGTPPPPADPPIFGSVSDNTVAPGDTLIITGSKFSSVPSENTVTFRNPLSSTHPFQATSTELRLLVDADATSGAITVATTTGSDTGDSVTVVRNVGDVFVFGGLGANTLSVPNPTGSTRYLVVPHGTSTAVSAQADPAYKIESATLVPALAAQTEAEKSSRSLHPSPNNWFESRRWEDAAATYERYGAPGAVFDKKPTLGAQVALPTRQFYVLKTTTGDQNLASSYQRINAELRYDGSKCLVYADIDTLTGGNFSQANLKSFGQAFDTSIETTNVSYFGTYSDVDGNDKVILLVTPVVNRLEEPGCQPNDCNCGFIAGFFNARDLYGSPPVPAGTTNHAEVLYLLAADPTGVWDCPFPVDATAAENLGTIPHEHEHLTSFSHRLFQQGGTVQVTWLEEGMAHMAEDLNGDNSSNIGRGKLYREDPGAVSLEDENAGLEQRGGIYLMLRLLVDRYGTGILKTIVQSKCSGRACLQNASGLGFNDVLAQFLAAQYLSGRGITADERFNYDTINLDDPGTPSTYFGPLLVGAQSAGDDINGNVRRSTGDFLLFDGVLNQSSQFRFTDPNTNKLGLRSVVVRVQ